MQAWKAMVHVSKLQTHVSRSFDPFLNLSVEHYLLQNSPPHSTVLFLYVNRPCVVIGRNQNPWLEADLGLLNNRVTDPRWENVDLVRRRSGGGTVFHDMGNVNYCVICPTANFTRDKHAEMITEVIREKNLRARVNERHDIVLDQGSLLEEKDWPDLTDMHRTVFHPNAGDIPPLKVSGSAYKMIRQRCLHHGTCLLTSKDLPRISQYLTSPSRPFIKARGVDSVRSSIANAYPANDIESPVPNLGFQCNVVEAFQKLHGTRAESFVIALRVVKDNDSPERDGEMHISGDGQWVSSRVGDDFNSVDEVREGIQELQSSKWLYGQTPQFTLSSHSDEEDERARPPLPEYFPPSGRVYLKVRAGKIECSRISVSANDDSANAERNKFDKVLKDRNIHDIDDFNNVLNQVEHSALTEVSGISRWLNTMFGKKSRT